MSDLEEVPPAAWSIAYAYDPLRGGSQYLGLGDPHRSDGDGDGMSDLFEQTQNTLTTSPWADPNNRRVYNPVVWNESPVALYVSDTSTQGYVAPGATIVYTTSTANNLSSSQDLAGTLSLALPTGVTGAPPHQDGGHRRGQRRRARQHPDLPRDELAKPPTGQFHELDRLRPDALGLG
ncbi:MAG: hypothetical protein R2854_05015 [Caldilineaceae bacterium]